MTGDLVEGRGMAEQSVGGGGGVRLLGVLVMVFAALAISLSLLFSPFVFEAGMAPLALLVLRSAVFVVFLFLVTRLSGHRLGLPGPKRLTAFGVGVVYILGAGGYLWSVFYLPVSLAVLIFYIYPILTLILASLLDRHAPRLPDLALLLVAFGGLALALGVSVEQLDLRGVALVVAGAFSIATSFVWMARKLSDEDSMAVTFHMAISGALLALVAALAAGAFSLPAFDGRAWWALAGVLVFFCAGFFSIFRGIALIGSVRAATIMNLEPVATLALAPLILGEHLSPRQWIGAAIVIFAVVLSQRR